MQISVKYKSKYHTVVALLTYLMCFSINVEQALSAGGNDAQSTTIESSTTPPAQNASALTATPTTFIQAGTSNYANLSSNTGSLNYPGCNGTCAFAILRTSPSNNNGSIGNQIEGVVGLIYNFSSPDQTNAETNRQMIDIQRQRSDAEIASNYIKQIAEACQARDFIRAELNARGLARIWNEDYKNLLGNICQ